MGILMFVSCESALILFWPFAPSKLMMAAEDASIMAAAGNKTRPEIQWSHKNDKHAWEVFPSSLA